MARTQIDLELQSQDQSLTNAKIKDAVISGAKIATDAAIAYSKLSIADSDLSIAKTSGLQSALDAKLALAGGTMSGAIAMGTSKITGLGNGSDAQDAVTKSQLDGVISTINSFEWQPSGLDYVVDNTAVPATEVTGDRYILSHDGGAPHINYDGASAGDIVEFDGTSWVAVTPTTGMFIAADDEPTLIYLWGGASWAAKYFESTTASTGLTKVGFDVRLDASAAGTALDFAAGVLNVDVGIGASQVVQLDGSAKLPAVDGSALTAVNAATLDSLDSLDFLRTSASSAVATANTLNIDSGATLSIDGFWDIGGTMIASTAAELNILNGVTSTTAELNILDGVTSTAAELNILDGALVTTAELNALGTIVVRETPTGLVNGANVEYTLANTPISGSEEIYLNGLLQDLTNDYTIAGAVITMVGAPQTGDYIRVSYRY